MANFNEAIQISIVSVGIVFASLAVFYLLIQLMGSFFARADAGKRLVTTSGPVERTVTDLEKAQVAAIMAAFREEFGDRIVEMKITRKH